MPLLDNESTKLFFMKKIQIYALTVLFLSIFSNCTKQKSIDKEAASEKKDRNMFGHHIPRGLTINSENLAPGYVMYAVPNSSLIYLVNRNGEVVHQWKGNYEVFHSYLLDDGSLFQAVIDPDYPIFDDAGPYGRIQKISWDSKVLWDFEYANDDHVLHHDFALMPNDHILAIAYEAKSFEDAIAGGRKPELTPKSGPWMEKIIEIDPQGSRGGRIVWEWHIADHLIQDFDKSKANYGNPADHPELLDFNIKHHIPPAITQDSLDILIALDKADKNQTPYSKGSDIYHINAIHYNADLDQIVFSSPEINEIFIIDHSTSTQEAAGHQGGNSGKGGDFLYRWGNPTNYKRGDTIDRQLFYQHNVKWIENEKPGAGNLTLYNNDIPGRKDSLNYSAIFELKLPKDEKGNYILEKDRPFGPVQPFWKYIAKDTVSFYSSFISGAHRMKSGNTFINEGAKGRFFEVTPEGEVVWEFLNPYRGEIRKLNGDPVAMMPMTYWVFRATFIPADHPAFKGKDLKPLDPQPDVFTLPPKEKEGEKP